MPTSGESYYVAAVKLENRKSCFMAMQNFLLISRGNRHFYFLISRDFSSSYLCKLCVKLPLKTKTKRKKVKEFSDFSIPTLSNAIVTAKDFQCLVIVFQNRKHSG